MEEIKSKNSKFTRGFLWKVIAIITFAIMFIPMMYSLFYLGAFWDPYGNLKNVPVAFVNLDEPYMNDGKSYTFGKDLENKLKDNDSFKWKFVSYDNAKEGVDGTSYYAMIVIPKDFSQKLANSTTGDFQKPQIIYRANKGRNFIFSLLSLKGAESLQDQITNSISKETTKTLVDKLYDVKDSLKDASDAQTKIQDGTQKLVDGGNTLATNLGTAYDGANKLSTGLNTAANSSATLENGLNQLANGGKTLNDGLGTASKGSSDLANGLGTLANYQSQLIGGIKTLAGSMSQFKATINDPNGKMQGLVNGAAAAAQSVASLDQNLLYADNQMSKGLETAADNVDQSSSALDQVTNLLQNGDTHDAEALLAQIKEGNAKISASLRGSEGIISKNFSTPLNNLKAGTAAVASGISTTQQQTSGVMDQMIAGTQQLQDNGSLIQANLSTAASKTNDLAGGLNKLDNGSSTLLSGLNTASNGAGQLQSGLSTAASSTGTLANGLGQLTDGSNTLASGLVTLNDGTNKLKTGLNDGYTKLNDNLKFTSTAMSKFVSNPVSLSDQSINPVKKYGEGLAPYFISLSLWLGAMFINLVLTLIDKLKLADNKFYNSFLGKFAVGVVLVTVQATVLAISLNSVLGLEAVKTSYLYLNNIFTSIVFFSVMYGLSAAFGIMSTPISFVLLILQLSSCAGTFPIETAPAFYRVVNTFIPMTYTVNIVRMILSGINHSDLMYNISILLTFMFTLLIGGFLLKNLRTKVSKQLTSKETAEEAA